MRAMTLLMITTILAMPLAGCVDSGADEGERK